MRVSNLNSQFPSTKRKCQNSQHRNTQKTPTLHEMCETKKSINVRTWVREETICSLGKISALDSAGAAKTARRGKTAVAGRESEVAAGADWCDLELEVDILSLKILGGGESGGDGGGAVEVARRAITLRLSATALSEMFLWLAWICCDEWREKENALTQISDIIRRGSLFLGNSTMCWHVEIKDEKCWPLFLLVLEATIALKICKEHVHLCVLRLYLVLYFEIKYYII